jgi:hypothetical protein
MRTTSAIVLTAKKRTVLEYNDAACSMSLWKTDCICDVRQGPDALLDVLTAEEDCALLRIEPR